MIFIFNIAIFQSLLPLLYFWYIRKNIIQEVRPILPFITLCFIAGIYEFVFTAQLNINLIPWYFIYDILSFFTILYFFYNLLDKKNKGFYFISALLYFVLFYIAVKNHNSDNYLSQVSYLVLFTTFFIVVSSLVWFKKVSTQTIVIPLMQSPNFYFVFGFLSYYTGTIVLFLLSNYIHQEDISNFVNYWIINVFFNVLHKSLLIIGLRKSLKK